MKITTRKKVTQCAQVIYRNWIEQGEKRSRALWGQAISEAWKLYRETEARKVERKKDHGAWDAITSKMAKKQKEDRSYDPVLVIENVYEGISDGVKEMVEIGRVFMDGLKILVDSTRPERSEREMELFEMGLIFDDNEQSNYGFND